MRRNTIKTIFESPDYLKFGNERHGTTDKDARSFVADIDDDENIRVMVGPPGYPHNAANLFGMYTGRMFINGKIIAFWRHPEKYLLVKILKTLEKHPVLQELNIKFLGNRDWRIEIYGDVNKDTYNTHDIDFEYRKDLNNAKFPILDDYVASAIQSKDAPAEDYAEHQKSPLLKKHKTAPFGFGSKHPEATSRFREKMQAPFESYTGDRKLVRETLYEKMSLIFPKNKWVNLDIYDKDYLKDELFTIIDKAYSPIGGHVRINSPEAIENDKDLTYWNAINIDGDDADAVIFGKKTQFGYKISGWGHDGAKESKRELMKHLAKILQRPGYYVEISGKPAEILIKNYNVSFIDSKEEVEKLFPGSKVEWLGNHPEFSSVIDGFYRRSLGKDMTEIEVVLGKPKI